MSWFKKLAVLFGGKKSCEKASMQNAGDLGERKSVSKEDEAPHLHYRTPGNSDPHGKARVFFAAHPDDFETFFEPIVEMIWEYQRNTAFWYEEKPFLPTEELLPRLSEMNLIVMPVTTRLLTGKSRAIEIILPFAEEKHIPVLPLMMETGLDDVFTKIFGEIQYLMPGDTDPTAIPFEQKLKKYISGVLIGDEQAQRIRDSFDAYIFLSYRKKDRKYAQELMRMIHRNERYRDIAIWYDEYLTPGENFNETIRAALEKSDLFGLVVTPSLLEDPNYVMQHEFPAAREAGKPILPMEATETKREELEKHYEGIPACVHTGSEMEWNTALEESLMRIALQESDKSPEHSFLMGLAYLDGIDVEVDSEKAVKLIETAAEAGLEEALRKLVSMYHDGKGVPRDYHKSVEWQEKLVSLIRKKYQRGEYEKKDRILVFELWNLGDACYHLRQLEKARRSYEEMRTAAAQIDREFGVGIRDLSVSYHKLGDIERALGNPEGAKRNYEKALEIREKLAEETGTIESWRDLSVSYNKLGDIEKALGNLEGAKRNCERDLALSVKLAEETNTVRSRRDLSVSYKKLGDIEKALGNPEGAKRSYEKALEISEKLAEETDTIESRRDLSISYLKLGEIEKVLGNLKEAKRSYEKDLEISRKLAEETDTIESWRDLSVSYTKSGEIEKALGNPEGAKGNYGKALEINRKLAEATDTVESRRDLSVSFHHLGEIERVLGNLEGAKINFEKDLEISRKLAEETGTVESRRDLAVSYHKSGDIEKAMGNPEGAKSCYGKALEISEKLAEETNMIESRRDVSVSYLKSGEIEQALGNPEGAKRNYEKALEICEKLAEETGTIESRRDLAVSYHKSGEIEQALGNPEGAKRSYEKALEISRKLAEETDTIESWRDLSITYHKSGDIEKALGNPEGAKGNYEKALEISGRLARQLKTMESFDDLAVSCYKIGCLGNMSYLQQAYEIWKELAERFPAVTEFARRKEIAGEILTFLQEGSD